MTLERVLLSVVRGAALLVPVVALVLGNEMGLPDALYPNVVWKNFFFRFLVEIMVGLWAVVAWSNPAYRPRFSWILGCYAAFLVALGLAAAAGLRPAYSFWGNYERMEGWIGHAHLFAFTVVTSCVFDRETLWRWFLRISLGVCAIACCLAVVQYLAALGVIESPFDRLFHQVVRKAAEGETYFRVDAILASPVYLASYVVMHVFFAAITAMHVSQRWLRGALVALAVLCSAVAFMTETRIAQVGLVAGGSITLGLLAAFGKDQRLRRGARLAATLVGVLVAIVVVLAWFKPPFVSDIPILRRIVNLSIERALDARLYLWGMVWQGFVESPLLGWGQENFAYLFNQHFHPHLFGRELPDWWDHPHNAYFHWLSAGGLLAFVPYLGLWGTGLWYLWKRTGLTLAERSLWTGMLVAYGVYNTLQLDHLFSYVFFFGALGYIHARATRREEVAAPAGRASVPVAAVAIVAIAAAGYWINAVHIPTAVKVAGANYHVRNRDPETGRSRADLPEALQLLREALDHATPMGQSQTRDQLVNMTEYAMMRLPRADAATKREMVELAVNEMMAEVEANPGNLHDLFWLGKLLNVIGEPGQALQYLQPALETNTKRQLVHYMIAESYLQMGRLREASKHFRAAWEAYPEGRETQIQSAIGAVLCNDRVLYRELEAAMRGRTKTAVFRIDQRVIDAMEQMKWLTEMVELLPPIIEETKVRRASGIQFRDGSRARFLSYARVMFAYGRRRDARNAIRYMIDNDSEQSQKWRTLLLQFPAGPDTPPPESEKRQPK